MRMRGHEMTCTLNGPKAGRQTGRHAQNEVQAEGRRERQILKRKRRRRRRRRRVNK